MTKRVLLIDDMESSLKLMATHCEKLGFETIHKATHIKQARNILNEYEVDLIICDHFLGVGTGTYFLEELRKESKYMKIPFILITANHESDIILNALEKGANNYIEKPYDFEDFSDKIKALV